MTGGDVVVVEVSVIAGGSRSAILSGVGAVLPLPLPQLSLSLTRLGRVVASRVNCPTRRSHWRREPQPTPSSRVPQSQRLCTRYNMSIKHTGWPGSKRSWQTKLVDLLSSTLADPSPQLLIAPRLSTHSNRNSNSTSTGGARIGRKILAYHLDWRERTHPT